MKDLEDKKIFLNGEDRTKSIFWMQTCWW